MNRLSFRMVVALTLALAVGAVSLGGEALAAKRTKSTSNEADFLSYDAEAKTVTLKIRKKGKGPNRKLLKPGKEVTFRVVPEGSVLKRTSVAINGKKAELKDIPPGKRVLVYWIPDPENDGGFFARKIDVILSEEELNERYGTE